MARSCFASWYSRELGLLEIPNAEPRKTIFYDRFGFEGLWSIWKAGSDYTGSTVVAEILAMRYHIRVDTFHGAGHDWG